MDTYDSDSSGLDDDGDYTGTDTGVLLGYASKEALDDTISHLGGWPTWLDESNPPPGTFANCKVCGKPLHLLLELNGNLPEHFANHERRLYIFGCSRKTCNRKLGSIRALRATRKTRIDQERPKEKEQQPRRGLDLGASLFGADSLTGSVSGSVNPFSPVPPPVDLNANLSLNPFAVPTSTATQQQNKPEQQTGQLAESFADKVRISSSTTDTRILPPEVTDQPSTPWPPRSTFPKPYRHLYLDADYEILSRPSSPTVPVNVTFEDADNDDKTGGPAADPKDAFESELDKTFIRFSSRLAQNPEQVLRYEFRGEPLLYSHTDEVGRRLHRHDQSGKITVTSGGPRMPRCEYCLSERVFEVQLVPHAISVLEEDREGVGLGPNDEPGMEWGSVILGVCGNDCAPNEAGVTGWREEWIGVQWEEAK